MVKKIHIKAVAKQNIKVDAYWYRCGEKMDCYLTPNELELFSDGLDNIQVIPEVKKEGNPITINQEKEKMEVKSNGVQKPKLNEGNSNRKSAKTTSK